MHFVPQRILLNFNGTSINSMFHPLKSFRFYVGTALGLAMWIGLQIPGWVLSVGIYLSLVALVAAALIIVVFLSSSLWPAQKREYAKLRIHSVGPVIAKSLSGSGHLFTGLGIVGISHFVYTGFKAGTNLQLFFLSLCLAVPAYAIAYLLINYVRQTSSGQLIATRNKRENRYKLRG